MATTNANINVSVTGQQSLDKLKSSIDKTNSAFASFKTILGGLATGAFVTNAYKMAASIDDIAKATGIGTKNVLAFSQAVAANGGSVDGAVNAMGKFSQAVDGAAGGSRELQEMFLQLGISLTDLRTLSEADLLRKVVDGLGKAGTNAGTTANAIKLFGKEFKSVDFAGVASDIDRFSRSAGLSADAVTAAGEAEQNFSNSIFRLQIKLLEALKPISELAKQITSATDAIGRFVDIGIKIAMVVGSFFLVGKAIQILVRGAALLAEAPVLIAVGWQKLVKTFELIGWQWGKVKKAGEVTQATIEGLAKRSKFLQEAIGLLSKGIAIIVASLVALYETGKSVLEWMGILGDNTEEAAKKQEDLAKKTKEQAEAQAAAARAVQDAIAKEINALQKLVAEYDNSLTAANQKYEMDTKLIGLSEDQKNIIQELASAESAYRTEVLKLTEQYVEAQKRAQNGSETDKRLLPEIAKALGDLTEKYREQIGVVEELVNARNIAQAAEQLRLFGIQQETDALGKLRDLEHEIATVTMTGIEKKYADITYAARKAAEEAIRTEEIRRGALLTEEEKQKYYELANKRTEELINKEGKLYEKSREFSTGWKKAFGDYVDNATNAAKKAEQIFSKAMSGMEDLIVNFAKTGKFEWKNFVNMMAEELLRAQIQQIFAQMFGGMQNTMRGGMTPRGNTGGIFGGNTGGIFGGGNQGGGNILSGIGNVIGGIAGGIGSVVKGIGSTIGDLFGGWFANGGTLGAGQWGIAGERGPELISGPASITPMGSTNVTYNISAVDAQSFQALVARDPQFIHAVAMQGARSIPQGRR